MFDNVEKAPRLFPCDIGFMLRVFAIMYWLDILYNVMNIVSSMRWYMLYSLATAWKRASLLVWQWKNAFCLCKMCLIHIVEISVT